MKLTFQDARPLGRAKLLGLGLILASRDVAGGPLREAVENVGDSLFEVQPFCSNLDSSFTVNNGPVGDRFCRTDGTLSEFLPLLAADSYFSYRLFRLKQCKVVVE